MRFNLTVLLLFSFMFCMANAFAAKSVNWERLSAETQDILKPYENKWDLSLIHI